MEQEIRKIYNEYLEGESTQEEVVDNFIEIMNMASSSEKEYIFHILEMINL